MAMDDDFEIPSTANTNDPFFSQNGGIFMPITQTQDGEPHMTNNDMNHQHPSDFDMVLNSGANMINPMDMQRFDGSNLIEAPLQVNVLNIEYAKTSKNIDVRRLKQVIWQLLCESHLEEDKVRAWVQFEPNLNEWF